MKVRITASKDNLLSKEFNKIFDCEFFSRSTDFDIRNADSRQEFIEQTSAYDMTVNLTNGGDFSATNLLCELETYCFKSEINHKVFNIGSYICMGLVHAPTSKYPVEKAALKFAHKKITNSYIFHGGYLDSYLLSLNFIKDMSSHIENHYTHLNLLELADIGKNIKFMIDNSNIKELSLQSNQPGNHRINDGVGPILPGLI